MLGSRTLPPLRTLSPYERAAHYLYTHSNHSPVAAISATTALVATDSLPLFQWAAADARVGDRRLTTGRARATADDVSLRDWKAAISHYLLTFTRLFTRASETSYIIWTYVYSWRVKFQVKCLVQGVRPQHCSWQSNA